MKTIKTADELGRYSNHPLAADSRVCKKCDSINTKPPMYYTDWFDCLECGHSWEPTAKQKEKMFRK